MEFFERGSHPSLITSKRSISTSFLERRLSFLSVSGRKSESSEQLRGPFGLNLLWEPSDPRIDFVFVHGLRGGSRKTWSLSDNPAHYWPKEWLPLDPDFKYVRIHTYGYNADWGERKGTVLSIHDFGQALVGDIFNSPHIRKNGDTPIVLIGHSMGGLVIKKAYLIAKQDPNYHALGARFHSLFFLATPHRGADNAQLLKNILRISNDSKIYVNDLIPQSGTIQTVNDEFRHVYQGAHLWSFFETVKTNLGFSHELIVEKDSAIIGLPHERIQLLNADHRHVCKFADPSDSNYSTLRNAFVSTIESIEREWFSLVQDKYRSQMKILSRFLGVSRDPGDDLSNVIDKQVDGTCQWLIDNTCFNDWQSSESAPRYFWLNGRPAAGKSVVAGHVVKYLETCSGDCSYFFFRRGDKESSNVCELLRSLAFQMAATNQKIRQTLLEMQQDGEVPSKDDERMLWRTIFLARIFRIKLNQSHYWIIDALDECRNISQLFPLLSKIDKDFPLRIFITSRPSPSLERLVSQEKLVIVSEQMTAENSLKDIRLYLEANSGFLPVSDDIARSDLIDTVLEKSNGCFLWTVLVLNELESTHSEQQIWEVLKDVPTEMDELYMRILDDMKTRTRDIELAKAILRWTVCAARPLTTEELKEALELDINETLPRVEKSITSVCGELIHVDSKMRVQVAHQTVRVFLMKEGLESEFAIDRVKENSRLAEVCLKYLGGEEMKTVRNRQRSAGRRLVTRSAFVDYASFHFSGHIAQSSSSIDTHFMMLEAFLNSNILGWIEYIARKGNLYPITQTAKNLKAFLQRRAKYRSPLGQAVYAVDRWANDLLHLVAAFGKSLILSPASIYFLVPPVCPPHSLFHKTFGNRQPCLKVIGMSEKDWDDRLSCMIFPQQHITAVACRDARFVVGLRNGTINVYYTSTLQEDRELNHGEPIRHLQFANINSLLASSGRRKVVLWDIMTGAQMWIADHKNDILTLTFSEDDTILIAATRTNQIASWGISTGKELDTCPLHETISSEQSSYRPPATHAQFSTELDLLAIAHRQRPISFWDMTSNSFIGQFHVSGSKQYPGPLLIAMKFNPNPEISLLAASYQEGHLVVLDPWNQEKQALIRTVAHTLAASSDGRILASGDGGGTIQLFEFETLRLIYRVTASDYNVNAIVFFSSNLQFIDIRADHYNIWEPPILVQQTETGDDQSENMSEEVLNGPQITGTNIWDGDLTITTLSSHHLGDVLFGGREDGSVAMFEVQTGRFLKVLYSHARNIAISSLCWNKLDNILASTDISGRFLARKVLQVSSSQWVADKIVLDERSSQAINQILLSPNGKLLLVSTATSDELWSLATGLLHTRAVMQPSCHIRLTHPTDPSRLFFIDSTTVQVLSWDTLSPLAPSKLIKFRNSFPSYTICYSTLTLLVTFSNHNASPLRATELSLWPLSSFNSNKENQDIEPLAFPHPQLAPRIKTLIGIHKNSLLFLEQSGWVCSIDLNLEKIKTEAEGYTRHFFIPLSWHSGREPRIEVTVRGDVVLAKGDEVVVFQRGLAFEEKVVFG